MEIWERDANACFNGGEEGNKQQKSKSSGSYTKQRTAEFENQKKCE
jgi:hypothetical protein